MDTLLDHVLLLEHAVLKTDKSVEDIKANNESLYEWFIKTVTSY